MMRLQPPPLAAHVHIIINDMHVRTCVACAGEGEDLWQSEAKDLAKGQASRLWQMPQRSRLYSKLLVKSWRATMSWPIWHACSM
jgi:hypothetical protein